MARTSLDTPSSKAVQSWSRRRLVICLLLGVLLGEAVVLALDIAGNVVHPFGAMDWWTYYSSVSMLRAGQGQSLYDVPSLSAFQQGLGRDPAVAYPYHPAYLLIIYPFVLLGPGPSYVAWMLFNLVLLASCLRVQAGALVAPGQERLFFLLVAASLPVYIALSTGQSSFIVLLGFTLLVLGMLLGSDLEIASGLVILLIKPQYIPVWLLLLLWRRRFRAVVYAACGWLVLLVVSYLMVGTSGLADYARLLASGPLPGAYPLSHTLNGLAHGLAPAGVAVYLYLLLTVAVLVGYILLLRGSDRRAEPRMQLAITVLVSMLVANYLVIYDLTIWAVLLALLWPLAIRGSGRVILAAALLAPWLTQIAAQYGIGFVWPTVGLELVVLAFLSKAMIDGRIEVCTGMMKRIDHVAEDRVAR